MEFILKHDLQIFNSINELSSFFINYLQKDLGASGEKYNLVLSGGSSPKHIFNSMAEEFNSPTYWDRINIFWGDERCVPPEHDESNYKTAYESLLTKVPVPENNIFRIRGESDPSEEANRYSQVIKTNVPLKNDSPVFDLVMLGLGEDGHTASIFPDQMNLINDTRVCAEAVHSVTGQKRITLTGITINNARNVVFIVTGSNKKKVLSEILNNQEIANKYPAYFIRPRKGKLIWLADRKASPDNPVR
jgi:6-phosphogluconolactonase